MQRADTVSFNLELIRDGGDVVLGVVVWTENKIYARDSRRYCNTEVTFEIILRSLASQTKATKIGWLQKSS